MSQIAGGDVFTPVERRVLEYAEAMTVTPPEVTDEMAGHSAPISVRMASWS